MGKRKGRYRIHKTASDQYMQITYAMARSDAWRSLSGAALKVYIELHTRFHGGNNGKLSLSFDEAARLLHLGKATVQRAFKKLVEHGLIRLTKQGHWYGRKANEYALTTKTCDGRIPTHEWRNWKPSTNTNSKRKKTPKRALVAADPWASTDGVSET